MARTRGKGTPIPDTEGPVDDPADSPAGRVPDLLRRVLALGLSGFFMTEEAVRKALGDTLPRDWADFAAEQSERSRAEFLDRLAHEISETLGAVDLEQLAARLLAGNTIEVKAEIRFVPREPEARGPAVRVRMTRKRPR